MNPQHSDEHLVWILESSESIKNILLHVTVKKLAFALQIQEVPGSNFDLLNVYPEFGYGFPQCLQGHYGIVPYTQQNHFLPNLFQLIVSLPFVACNKCSLKRLLHK
jgi:hypothetical protein